MKRGCPCCANHIAVKGKNDLATTHPQLAKEWHPTKNTLRPDMEQLKRFGGFALKDMNTMLLSYTVHTGQIVQFVIAAGKPLLRNRLFSIMFGKYFPMQLTATKIFFQTEWN